MNEDEPIEPRASGLAAPKRKAFGNKFASKRLSPDKVERQSRIALLAWNLLGGDSAIAFLNSYNLALEGRPLDLAIESPAGYEAVAQAIAAKARLG